MPSPKPRPSASSSTRNVQHPPAPQEESRPVAMNSRPIHVNLRKTRRGLYRSITSVAVVEVLLAVNYWWYTPTFNPYGIDKSIVAIGFGVLGLGQLVFLNFWHNLPKLRFAQMLSTGFTFAWGIGNTQQVFDGRASWALPVLLGGFCVWQILNMIEPPANPMIGG